jgi:hypothetical protein
VKTSKKMMFKRTDKLVESSSSPPPNKILEVTSCSSRQKITGKYSNQLKGSKMGGFTDSITSHQEGMTIRKSLQK